MQYISEILNNLITPLSNIPARQSIVVDIAFILIIAALFAILAKLLKQPLIPAYVIAGIILGPLVLGYVRNTDTIIAISEIGIAFLLFTAGLEISFEKIKQINLKKILLIGILQVSSIFLVGFVSARFFNLTTLQAVYLGAIAAFSSTMVVIKLLSDQGELVTMHGRLVLGILLLQDLFAILAVAVLMTGEIALMPILIAVSKLILLILIAIIIQKLILNRIFKFAAKSTELLLLTGLAVLFFFVLLTYLTNLSIAIGAFITGVLLANTDFKFELGARVTSLRDFFAILFFVALGMQLVFTGLGERITLILFFLAIIFIAKPILITLLLRITGYRPKTSFFTAISLTQLSEFSLILGMLGLTLGVLDSTFFSAVVLVTLLTMSLTPYMINYKELLYRIFKRPLKMLKFLPVKESLGYVDNTDKEIILAGCHRVGSILLKNLEKEKKKLLVIDYNPEIIHHLKDKKISCIYGDLSSPEILENLNIQKLKLVISTIPILEDNIYLLKTIKELNPKTTVILTATSIDNALELYEKGADYVILPKVIAGETLSNHLSKIISKPKTMKKMKKQHIKELNRVHNILY